MSLRARLVLGLAALTLAGLLLADVAMYSSLRVFLLNRVDAQLLAAREPALAALRAQLPERRRRPGAPRVSLPPGIYAEWRAPDGALVDAVAFTLDPTAPVPDLPETVRGDGPEPAAFTVPAEDRSTSYRARADALQGGGTLIVAVPLTDVQQTLRRLVVIEIVVTGGVLVAVAALGLAVVRLGLRPLERIEATAEAIAAGDLTRRIDVGEQGTEVARLGAALNAMLSQIEAAFRERERSESRLRQFLADASHELRTPLTSIRGYAELFRRGADRRPEDLAKAMRRIEDEAARMGVLVEDLLLLARLDEERAIERAPVDLSAVASDAVDDARVADPHRDITVEADDGVVVNGDAVRLRQVAANLLSNALRHTGAEARVRVSVRRAAGSALLEVTDTGPGIAPDDAARVFDRFYRGDASRERSTGGAGLGLAIVAAIAHAHGGRAEVESEVGKGSAFRVILPEA